jgi:L-serine dehydratase
MGPMLAARILDALREGCDRIPGPGPPTRLETSLHGSLAFTGQGHATDRAAILGLLGFVPDTLDPDEAERRLADLEATARIDVSGIGPLAFDPEKGVIFDRRPPLPGHANGMVLRAFDAAGNLHLPKTITRSAAASSSPSAS